MGFDLPFNINVGQMLQDAVSGVANATKGIAGMADGVLDNPALNPAGAVLDMIGGALGLPPAVTDVAKTAVGVATGNPVMIANGVVGLVSDFAQNPPNVTEMFDANISGRITDHGGYVKGEATTPYGGLTAFAGDAGLIEQGEHQASAVADRDQCMRAFPECYSPPLFPGLLMKCVGIDIDIHIGIGDRHHHHHPHPPHHHHPVPPLPFHPPVGPPSTPPPPPPVQGTPPPGKGTDGVEDPPKSPGSGISSDLQQIINDPTLSMEDKIMMILAKIMEGLDQDILDASAEFDQARVSEGKRKDDAKSSNAKGAEEAAAKANTDMDKLNLKLQRLMEKRKAMFELMSNFSTKFNEMAKTAIQNFARA